MTYRYDLHVHTDASPCSGTPPERVVTAAVAAGLDGIAITDHDTVANVDAVRAAAGDRLDVISGVEVTTDQGHMLALDVSEPPPQADPSTVIDHVHEQGGIAILSHPFDTLRQYYDSNLETIAGVADAIETINSRCVRKSFNQRAKQFAEQHSIPTTGGSDAHFPMEVGRAYTVTNRPVLEAIRNGTPRPTGRGRYVTGHIATKIHQFRQYFP